jgi:hypothetical protein
MKRGILKLLGEATFVVCWVSILVSIDELVLALVDFLNLETLTRLEECRK